MELDFADLKKDCYREVLLASFQEQACKNSLITPTESMAIVHNPYKVFLKHFLET